MRAQQALIVCANSTNMCTIGKIGVMTLVVLGSCWGGSASLPFPRHGRWCSEYLSLEVVAHDTRDERERKQEEEKRIMA